MYRYCLVFKAINNIFVQSKVFDFIMWKVQKNGFVLFTFVSLLFLALCYKCIYYNQFARRKIPRSYLYDSLTKSSNMKYVLVWTSSIKEPLRNLNGGQTAFIRRNCSIKNCYVTNNRHLLNNVTDFDVILFNGPEIVYRRDLPDHRSQVQSYVFVSTESSDYYYVPDFRYNKVFNFTWSYKLSSDIYYGYISIRNSFGEVIGPCANISWINKDDMSPINGTVKEKLKDKKIAAAWFVSNCYSYSKREKWALQILEELRKYNMTLDIYGDCLYKPCPKYTMDKCLQMLQRDYYFYFAFENSMSDDYVTEKLLTALNNYAVPVVFGGADYKR